MKEKWIEAEQMKRLTMDNLEEMGMFSLAHNCCYIDENGNTRYRDFEIDIDARELAKGLLKEMTEGKVSFESDEDFDDWMGCHIGEDGICTPRGLIATFYQNLWAMAELRERLKYYEDLEEQGRLLVLPCKVGDTVYEILEETVPNHHSISTNGRCRMYRRSLSSMLTNGNRMTMRICISQEKKRKRHWREGGIIKCLKLIAEFVKTSERTNASCMGEIRM